MICTTLYHCTFIFAAGSVLQAMAKAVEKASAVLVCFTHKYYESPNCRLGNMNFKIFLKYVLKLIDINGFKYANMCQFVIEMYNR